MRFINTLRRRGLALLLAVLMCLSMMPTGALAVGDADEIPAPPPTGSNGGELMLVDTNEEANHVHDDEDYERISSKNNSFFVEPAWESASHSTLSSTSYSNYSVFKDDKSPEEYTVKVNDTITLHSKRGKEKHRWSSSPESIATVRGDGKNATVTGVKSGTAIITHEYNHTIVGYLNQETFIVHVTDPQPEGIKVYCYTLLPWAAQIDPDAGADSRWNGMGFGYITNARDPKDCDLGDTIDIDENNFTPPSSYPNIKNKDGKTYTYAKDPSNVAPTEYTIQWNDYVSVAEGANAGNNDYFAEDTTSEYTYHRDGVILLGDKRTVSFYAKKPGAEVFTCLDAVSVDLGTEKSTLSKPATKAEEYEGKTYVFMGWYTDENCTLPADFENGTITEDTIYYGKYVLGTHEVRYQWNGLPNNLVDETGTRVTPTVPESVTVEDGGSHTVETPVSTKYYTLGTNGLPDTVYTFSGWTPPSDVFIDEDNQIEDITSDITLTGTWTGVSATDVVATVTFEIENGEWSGSHSGSASFTQSVALTKDGKFTPATNGGTASFTGNDIPSGTPTDGYGNETWTCTAGNGNVEDPLALTVNGTAATFKLSYTQTTFDVTYEWTGLPTDDTPLYNDHGKRVESLAAPTGATNVTTHDVDPTYSAGYTLYTLDSDNCPIGKYTFSGWKNGDVDAPETLTLTNDVTLKGTWTPNTDNTDVENLSATVTFEIRNGTWNKAEENKKTAPITKRVPLTANGVFAPDGEATLEAADIPASTANENYSGGTWATSDTAKGTLDDAGKPATVKGNVTFTITYTEEDSYTVSYYKDGLPVEDSTSTVYSPGNLIGWPGSESSDDAIDYNKYSGYALDKIIVTPKSDSDPANPVTYQRKPDGTFDNLPTTGAAVVLYFEKDTIGNTDPETGAETGDGTPDKYQVKVIYAKGEHGTINPDKDTISKIVKLTGENGAYLTQKNVTISTTFGPVPEVTANSGWAFDFWSSGVADDLPEVVIDYAPSLTADNTTVYGGSTITFTATYDVDEKKATGSTAEGTGDGIPDKYQSTATYRIVNGTWDGTSSDDRTQTISLMTRENQTDAWTPTNAKFMTPYSMTPSNDYATTGSWDIVPSTKPADSDTNKNQYTFTYTFGQYTATVRFEGGSNGSLEGGVTSKPVVIKDSSNKVVERAEMDLSSYAPTPKPDDGYMFEYWAENGEKADLTKQTLENEDEKNFTAVFTEDRFNENGTSGGDNIADKYQIKVVFNWDTLKGADNSIPSNTYSKVITLKGENGSNATSETLTLNQKLTVPNITGKGVWDFAGWTSDEDVPLDRSATIQGGTTITYTANFTPNDNRKVIITVKAASLTAEYDGTEKSVAANSFEAVTASDGKTYTVTGLTTSGASGTDVSDSKTIVVSGNDNAVVKNATGATVSPDAYTLVIEDGELTITPRPITLTSNSASKTYDGSALTNDTVRVTSGSWAKDEGATYTVTGRQTNIGSSDNTFTITFNEGTKKENYTITPVYGTLTVRSAGSPPTQEEEEEEEEPRRPVIINNGGGGGTGDTGNNGSNTLTDINDLQTPLADMGLNTTDHYAYLAGFSDGTIRPLANITRAEVATIFFRLMSDNYRTASWATTNSFPDVKADEWYTTAISTVANASLMSGDSSGNFRPNDPITRGEFASIASRLAGNDVTPSGSFSDVSGHWAKDAIELAAGAGWIQGSNGQFRPNAYITRAEAATIVNAMVERKPHKDHLLESMTAWPDNPSTEWYYAAIQEATNTHDFHFGAEGEEASAATADYESWTSLGQPRDWSALMTQWSQAASQPQQAAEAPVGGQLPDAAAGDQQ